MIKKLFITLTVSALAISMPSVYAKNWSEIRFGIDASYAPFESNESDGKPVGFDIDLGDEICRRTVQSNRSNGAG